MLNIKIEIDTYTMGLMRATNKDAQGAAQVCRYLRNHAQKVAHKSLKGK
jgi:hypothetical protein